MKSVYIASGEHIKDSQKSLHPFAKRKSKTRSSSILSVAVGRNTNLLVLSKSLVERTMTSETCIAEGDTSGTESLGVSPLPKT